MVLFTGLKQEMYMMTLLIPDNKEITKSNLQRLPLAQEKINYVSIRLAAMY